MQSQYTHSNNPSSSMPSWMVLVTTGFLVGQQTQTPSYIGVTLDHFSSWVDAVLVPLYTTLVLIYLSLRLVQSQAYFLQPGARRPPGALSVTDSALLETEGGDVGDEEQEQPINMSGKFKLISIENFDAFLEVQGVPWALRRAACKARPVHRITHKGNRLTIRIEGIITTQTTYIINGPPVEINIRGRIFLDRVTYLDNGQGIRGVKKAITENYDVFIERVLSDDKQTIVLTSQAVFKDGKEPIESRQVFQRIE